MTQDMMQRQTDTWEKKERWEGKEGAEEVEAR